VLSAAVRPLVHPYCHRHGFFKNARDVRISTCPTTHATEQQAVNERAVLQAVVNSICGTDGWFEGAPRDAAPDSPEGWPAMRHRYPLLILTSPEEA
jgi:hypothetical protein